MQVVRSEIGVPAGTGGSDTVILLHLTGSTLRKDRATLTGRVDETEGTHWERA